jgi:hydrogenase maturation factor
VLTELLSLSGARRPDVLIGPRGGEDAAVIKRDDAPYLVAASDPIVGASDGAGRLLVHVNANDVACKGGDPSWFVATLIVPVRDGVARVRALMEEIHEACLEIGAAVVGGHTELTDRYDRAVISGTMLGPSRYDLRLEHIRAGDAIIATKHVGLEGMSIIARDRPDLLSFLGPEAVDEARSWRDGVSILKEAQLMRSLARYMHDPTEGGLAGGLLEMSLSGLTPVIEQEQIPLSPLTKRAAERLGFDPLHLISSGVLLAVVPPEAESEAMLRLSNNGVPSRVIGRFCEAKTADNTKGVPILDAHEELWRVLEKT